MMDIENALPHGQVTLKALRELAVISYTHVGANFDQECMDADNEIQDYLIGMPENLVWMIDKILELQERLRAAEAETVSYRQLKHDNSITEKKLKAIEQALDQADKRVAEYKAENTQLRAMAEAAKAQEPVAWNRYDNDMFVGTVYKLPPFNTGISRYKPLYAIAPIVDKQEGGSEAELRSMLKRWIPFGKLNGDIARLIIAETEELLQSHPEPKQVQVSGEGELVRFNISASSDSLILSESKTGEYCYANQVKPSPNTSAPAEPQQNNTVTYRKDTTFNGVSVGRIADSLELLFCADLENDEYHAEIKLNNEGIKGLLNALKFFGHTESEPKQQAAIPGDAPPAPSSEVIHLAMDFIRCGIGSNYGDHEKREEMLAKYRDPIKAYFDQLSSISTQQDSHHE